MKLFWFYLVAMLAVSWPWLAIPLLIIFFAIDIFNEMIKKAKEKEDKKQG